MSNVQHIRVKIFAETSEGIDLGEAIPIFHRWIQTRALPETLIDVADYRHVPDGPGVMLIAHEAHYSLDQARGRLGLMYNRRTAVDGTTHEKLHQAFHAALSACSLLEQEPAFQGKLRFRSSECEIDLNDRLLTPNTDEVYAEIKPEIDALFNSVLGDGTYNVCRNSDKRELLRFSVSGQPSA